MSLRLSHSHGAVWTKYPKAKITTAAITKAISAGGLSPQRHLPFQIRQTHNPTSPNANGTHKPKLGSQNWKNGAMTPFHVFCNSRPNDVEDPKSFGPSRKKGAPNSVESWAQPGCHFSTDAAWNCSVVSHTKKVAGMKAAISNAVACLRIGAPRKTSGHIFGCEIKRAMPAMPSSRTKLTINLSSVARSKNNPTTSTIVSAMKVCR